MQSKYYFINNSPSSLVYIIKKGIILLKIDIIPVKILEIKIFC